MRVAEIIGYQYVQNLALEERVQRLTVANAELGRTVARYAELHGELPPESAPEKGAAEPEKGAPDEKPAPDASNPPDEAPPAANPTLVDGHVDCPCWVTGVYRRVEGCSFHPWDL